MTKCGGNSPKWYIQACLNLEERVVPPYRFEVYSRGREDSERYSEETLVKSGYKLPLSNKIYDSLLCSASKNTAGSHPLKCKGAILIYVLMFECQITLDNTDEPRIRHVRLHVSILAQNKDGQH